MEAKKFKINSIEKIGKLFMLILPLIITIPILFGGIISINDYTIGSSNNIKSISIFIMFWVFYYTLINITYSEFKTNSEIKLAKYTNKLYFNIGVIIYRFSIILFSLFVFLFTKSFGIYLFDILVQYKFFDKYGLGLVIFMMSVVYYFYYFSLIWRNTITKKGYNVK